MLRSDAPTPALVSAVSDLTRTATTACCGTCACPRRHLCTRFEFSPSTCTMAVIDAPGGVHEATTCFCEVILSVRVQLLRQKTGC